MGIIIVTHDSNFARNVSNRILRFEGGSDEGREDSLSQINYYNIINGYKKVFLKRDLKGNLVDPEEFKSGSNFNELYALYQI